MWVQLFQICFWGCDTQRLLCVFVVKRWEFACLGLLKGLYWACEPFVYMVRLLPICCSHYFLPPTSISFFLLLFPSFWNLKFVWRSLSLVSSTFPLLFFRYLSLSLFLCGSVSMTPSSSAALRSMAPLGGAEDGYNLFSTRGVLSFIQSTTRRAYQQVLEVLDENQRRWPLTSDPWICPERLTFG